MDLKIWTSKFTIDDINPRINVGSWIASGSSSTVYNCTLDEKSGYVIRVQIIDSESDFKTCINIQELAAKVDIAIGVELYGISTGKWVSGFKYDKPNLFGYCVMKKAQMDLLEYFVWERNHLNDQSVKLMRIEICNRIKDIQRRLLMMGIRHGDVCYTNIVLDFKEKEGKYELERLALIDFERAKIIDHNTIGSDENDFDEVYRWLYIDSK